MTKFTAICESDFPITEEVKEELKDTLFVGNEDCFYCFEMTEIINDDISETNKEGGGIWLLREYYQGGVIDRKFACSNCGFESGHVMTNWKYCPACGNRNYISAMEKKRREGETDD